jgi:hypothetical protein
MVTDESASCTKLPERKKMKPDDEAAIKNLVDVNELAYLELRQPLDEILHFKNFVGPAAKQGYLFHLLHETFLEFPTDDAADGGSVTLISDIYPILLIWNLFWYDFYFFFQRRKTY